VGVIGSRPSPALNARTVAPNDHPYLPSVVTSTRSCLCLLPLEQRLIACTSMETIRLIDAGLTPGRPQRPVAGVRVTICTLQVLRSSTFWIWKRCWTSMGSCCEMRSAHGQPEQCLLPETALRLKNGWYFGGRRTTAPSLCRHSGEPNTGRPNPNPTCCQATDFLSGTVPTIT
jgi:hypothetical protein